MSWAIPRWLPNAISIFRIALIPVWLATAAILENPVLAFLTVLAMGVSDILDGYLARRFNLTTTLGAALDATADKASQLVVFGWLALRPIEGFGRVPLEFLVPLLLRDATMVVGLILIWMRCRHAQVRHRWHGKAASALVFILLLVLHWPPPEKALHAGFAMTGILLVLSTLLYARDGIQVLRSGAPSNAE